MYVLILLLPFLASIFSGLFGRKIGVFGSYIITSGSLIIATILGLIAFFEVALSNSPLTIYLLNWISSEDINITYTLNFDSLTVSMFLAVLIISAAVHIYSVEYMSEDPHQQRFFSYLSLFTGLMLVLITADNYLFLFIGWEGVGISSFLLVSFWFTRVQANTSALSAILYNRVGDMFLTIGLFTMLLIIGNIDYPTVFSITSYINENLISLIGILLLLGAMAKSAQLGLHAWLPQAMEGGKTLFFFSDKITRNINISSNFINDINNKTINQYGSKYLKNNKIIYEVIIGNLLGDGHINRKNIERWPNINSRLEFTFSISNKSYLDYLKNVIYKDITGKAEPTPWPNPNITGKTPTQYWFGTKALPFITNLHKEWYRLVNNNKFIKIVPLNISDLLTQRGLAHWIMDDGYYTNGYVFLCTDSYSLLEIELLIFTLKQNFNLDSKIQKRISSSGNLCWRIRISISEIEKLRYLVYPYFIPSMLYKLNIKK